MLPADGCASARRQDMEMQKTKLLATAQEQKVIMKQAETEKMKVWANAIH